MYGDKITIVNDTVKRLFTPFQIRKHVPD